jgi:hypothetical protein
MGTTVTTIVLYMLTVVSVADEQRHDACKALASGSATERDKSLLIKRPDLALRYTQLEEERRSLTTDQSLRDFALKTKNFFNDCAYPPKKKRVKASKK